MPGTTPSSRSTCQKTLRTDFCASLSPTLLHYCTVVFCLFCIWMICRWICDLVDPVDVFHLLYRDPHVSIRVPLLHLIITICFFCLTLDNIEFWFKSFLNILLKQDFKISPKFRMDFSRTIDFFRILESFQDLKSSLHQRYKKILDSSNWCPKNIPAKSAYRYVSRHAKQKPNPFWGH